MKFRTQYNFTPSDSEINTGEIITLPDQSLSVKEILIRFRRGTLSPEDISRQVYYEDDPDIDADTPTLDDLSDYAIEADKNGSRIQSLVEEINSTNSASNAQKSEDQPAITEEA